MTRYLKYFYYLATNWNPRIALYMIILEIRGEKKYGINTTGADELNSLTDSGIDTSHATIYMPASYGILENLLGIIQKNNCQHLADVGCGKGRILCVAAHFGIKKLSGVDFSKEFCSIAEANLQITASKVPGIKYSISHNDAFYYDIPNDADCITLFNPFDEVIMEGVARNILTSYDENPRAIYIVYLNPLFKEIFLETGFKEIYTYKKLNYLEGSVLLKMPG